MPLPKYTFIDIDIGCVCFWCKWFPKNILHPGPCLAPLENKVKLKIKFSLTEKSLPTPKIIFVPILPLNAFRNYSLLTHSSHTHTNLILAPTHAPTSTPHTIWCQAPAAQPSQGQPRSCCPFCSDHATPPRSHPSTSEIAPTQPHYHAPPLHVTNPPPPSPPPPSSKLPIYLYNPIPISANPHPACPIHTHPI